MLVLPVAIERLWVVERDVNQLASMGVD